MSATEMRTIPDEYPSRTGAGVKWIPRKDPVVYPNDDQGPLTGEQLDFYRENGYLFLESLFPEEDISRFRSELRSIWEHSRNARAPEIIREPESEEIRSVFAVHRDNDVFRGLSRHPLLVQAVRQILGSDVYIHQSRINFKPGFTGKEFYWHSDFETWHVEDGMPRMRALSCSLALEDNYPFNGPLMVIPGSHRHYVSCPGTTPEGNYKSSLRRQIYGVPDHESLTRLVQEGGIDMPAGKAGSLILFDCNIMHGSNSNITPLPRSNVFLVYNSTENRLAAPFSGQAPRPEYIAARS
jgi:ectoine hydroxylase